MVASKFTSHKGVERLAASHRQLRGYLMDSEGRVLRAISSGAKGGKADRLTLDDLLKASGLESLDETSDVLDARGRTFRQRGCILRVTVFYQNWMDAWVGTR